MFDMPPRKLAGLMTAAKALVALGPLRNPLGALLRSIRLNKAAHLFEAAPYVVKAFESFNFRGVELSAPNETFADRLSVSLGERPIELFKVGPAHTLGDVIVHVPDARVVFAGDVLFVGHHPLVWAGTISDAISACKAITALDVDVVVPGHGPITDRSGVEAQIEYLQSLLDEVRAMIGDGVPESEAALRLMRRGFGSRACPERLAVNVHSAYCELRGGIKRNDVIALFAAMARLAEA
jgi:glyoxylase-like metal-dependent hydrolase (beta-lactamase superfamily II)